MGRIKHRAPCSRVQQATKHPLLRGGALLFSLEAVGSDLVADLGIILREVDDEISREGAGMPLGVAIEHQLRHLSSPAVHPSRWGTYREGGVGVGREMGVVVLEGHAYRLDQYELIGPSCNDDDDDVIAYGCSRGGHGSDPNAGGRSVMEEREGDNSSGGDPRTGGGEKDSA